MPGMYHIQASAPGYYPLKKLVNVRESVTTLNFTLSRKIRKTKSRLNNNRYASTHDKRGSS